MTKEKKILLILILFSIAIKFTNIGFTNCISTNGLYFVGMAESLLNGDYDKAFSAYIPILYPLLICLGNSVFNNLELTGQIISAVSGIGILLILYQLGKEMFDSRIGILIALFTVISPIFNTYSSKVMDDMPYGFLYTWAVYAGWRFLKKQDYKSGIHFSLAAALSYYIRPEGLGILLIVSAWFIFTKEGEILNIFKMGYLIVVVNLIFLVCIIPQMVIIYKVNGEFTFSGKTSYVLRDIDKFDSNNTILNGDVKSENTTFGHEDAERKKYKSEGGLLGIIIRHPLVIIKKAAHNLKDYLYRIPSACGYMLTIPLFFGIISRKQFCRRNKEELFLASIIVFNLLILSIFKEKYRHLMFAVPILYVWCAIGIYEIESLIKSKKYKVFVFASGKSLLTLILSICILAALPQTFSNISDYNYTWGNGPERIAGKWISENITKDARIISWNSNKVFYYAGIQPCLRLGNETSYEHVIEKARELNAGYIVLNSYESKKTRKSIKEFIGHIKNQDMVLSYKNEFFRTDYDIQIYKFM